MNKRVWLDLDNSTGFHMNTLSNRFSLLLQSYYRVRHRLNVAGWRIIAIVAEKSPISAREVAEYSVMDPIRVSKSVSELLRRKLITRKTDTKDRRRAILTLTKAGFDVYHDVAPFVARQEDRLYSVLSSAERVAFLDIILKLDAHSRAEFGSLPSIKAEQKNGKSMPRDED